MSNKIYRIAQNFKRFSEKNDYFLKQFSQFYVATVHHDHT